jgi:hypothetical protein
MFFCSDPHTSTREKSSPAAYHPVAKAEPRQTEGRGPLGRLTREGMPSAMRIHCSFLTLNSLPLSRPTALDFQRYIFPPPDGIAADLWLTVI